MKTTSKPSTKNWFVMALLALLGIAMEIVLLIIEMGILKFQFAETNSSEAILHRLITSAIWALITFLLIRVAKKKYRWNIFENRGAVPTAHLVSAFIITAVCIGLNAIDWGTLKLLGEFAKKDILLFIVQYLYYIFETALVLLIIIFSQRAAEQRWNVRNIPWGGITAGLTWGLLHALSGGLIAGLLCFLFAVFYGLIYLLTKKNIPLAYILIYLAFTI